VDALLGRLYEAQLLQIGDRLDLLLDQLVWLQTLRTHQVVLKDLIVVLAAPFRRHRNVQVAILADDCYSVQKLFVFAEVEELLDFEARVQDPDEERDHGGRVPLGLLHEG